MTNLIADSEWIASWPREVFGQLSVTTNVAALCPSGAFVTSTFGRVEPPPSIKKRALSRKAKWSVGAAVLTAAVASTSIALAYPQDGGGPNGGQLNVAQCGPNQSSTVVTQSAANVYSNVAPMLLPGAVRAFNAPAGKCVKLLFTA